MNVVYCCDDRFVWLAGISMLSLLEHNSNVRIYLLGWMLSNDNKEKLKQAVSNEKIEIIDVPKKYIYEARESSKWPAVTFVRLHMAEFLPENVKRALYLDCDTIVLDDLEALETWDMNGKLYCGVKDCLNWRYKRNIGLSQTDTYINGGVLLADIESLRKFDISGSEKVWMKKHSMSLSYPDQDMLNGIFQDKIGVLNARYNVMTIVATWDYRELCLLRRPARYYTEDEIASAKEHPAIIHYTTNLWIVRPWLRDSDHPWAKEFDRYMFLSPWSDKEKETVPRNKISVKILNHSKVLPECVRLGVIGWIHSVISPLLLKFKEEIFKKKLLLFGYHNGE